MASSLLAVDRILDRGSNYVKPLPRITPCRNCWQNAWLLTAHSSRACCRLSKMTLLSKNNSKSPFKRKKCPKWPQRRRLIGARQAVRTQVQTHQETDEPPDYEKIINDKMQEYSASQKANQLDLKDEQYCRDIRAALGEKEAARKNDESDEELEVLRNPNSSESLKYPIMGKLLEDPLRSKVCGHVYSRVGIEQLLHQNRHRR